MRAVRALLWLLALVPFPRAVRAQADTATGSAEYGATAVARAPKRAGSTELDASTVHAHPGAIGEPARMLLDAPGVSRASFAGGEISVWGATGSESKVYLDGVQIPRLFHTGGLRTTIHPALVRRVTLVPGAPDAAYGRGTGGVVEITSHKRLRGMHGALRADGIDASLAAWGGAQRVELLVAARQGYLERLAPRIFPDASEVLPLPSHTDAAARMSVRLDAVSTLSATWSYAREQLRVAREDAAGSQERRAQGWFHVVSLALEQRHRDGARVRIVPFVSLSEEDLHETFSGIPLRRAQDGAAYGLRADYVRANPRFELRLGIDARSERTRHERAGTLTLPAREGDVRLFGQAPVEAVAADRYLARVTNVAPHASLVWRLGTFELAPALRLETYVSSASRARPRVPGVPAVGVDRMQLLPEPRLRVTYRPEPWAALEARAGLLHQPPDPQDLSAVFGNPVLSPSRAWHLTAGPAFSLPAGIALELIGYYKALDDLAVRSDAPQPELARVLLARGRGESFGGSLSLRRETDDGVFGSAAYTLGRSQRSDPDGSLRPFDLDQTHVFSALLGYAGPHGLVSLRARAATGAPRTSVIGTYLDTKTDSVQPLFAAHNRARVPAFFQLDLHAEARFTLRDVLLALSLDVWNLTNHLNVEEVAYSPDFAHRRDLRGLPLLALIGFRVEF